MLYRDMNKLLNGLVNSVVCFFLFLDRFYFYVIKYLVCLLRKKNLYCMMFFKYILFNVFGE